MDALTFLESVSGYTKAQQNGSADKPLRLGVIDPAYVTATFPGTLPKVTFDGESTLSAKQYAVMSNYLPTASDRVVLVPVGTTYLIIGALDSDASARVGGSLAVAGAATVGGTLGVTGATTLGALTATSVTGTSLTLGGLSIGPTVDYSGTFTFTASTTNPTKGNSTYTAKYAYLSTNRIIVDIRITIGSTFVAGTGIYIWSLPVASTAHAANATVGCLYILDSGVALRVGCTIHNTVNGLQGILNGAGSPIGNTSQTWNTNDEIRITHIYEV